ncbi:MAG: D-alanyl-D-alanine carboxypeptidase/D-alanyl-D-alanine-endopeptidase [Paracoccaceae bacterium]
MTDRTTGKLTRRTLLGFLMYGVADRALAGAPDGSLRPQPRPVRVAQKSTSGAHAARIKKANLSGRISYAVADARTGEMLETYKPLVSHPPASVLKAITALYGLETLGPGHRFRTRLVADGTLVNGVLQGDLVLVGGGDPSLDTDDLFDMAARLKELGLREVKGRFLVYDAALPRVERIDDIQPEHVGYNPAVAGLNLNYNRIYLEWKRSGDDYAVTLDARSGARRPTVDVSQISVVDRSGPVFDYENDAGIDRWSVARRSLGREGGRWLPVRAPGVYTGEVFRDLSRSHGIVLDAPEMVPGPPRNGKLLIEHVSDDLTDICRKMLKFSTNLTAEIIGLSATRSRGAAVSDLAESGEEMSEWLRQRFGLSKARFVDHSGLGGGSRLSVQETVKCLVGAGPHGTLRGLLKTYPVSGKNEDGALRVEAKTGTLNFVSGLAGYVQTRSGRDLAFAIYAADIPRRDALRPEDRERPSGGRAWSRRARTLQRDLIAAWAETYDS